MSLPNEQEALRLVVDRLGTLLQVNAVEVNRELVRRRHGTVGAVDAVMRVGSLNFAVEFKATGAVGAVSNAIEQLQRYLQELEPSDGLLIPLIAVPFMGETGRQRCEAAGMSWLDLSDNAHIAHVAAPGLLIHVEGKPNAYKRSGRPGTAFAPKSSRIARCLLMHDGEPMTQSELAGATGMGKGYVSKIVNKLAADGLVRRVRRVRRDGKGGTITVPDPGLMLEAWAEVYDFSKHHIVRGHIASRSGEQLLGKLAEVLGQGSVPYAATGLAAAWLLDRFAGFRIVSLYLERMPPSDLLRSLSFHGGDGGANVWLIVPRDEGVFHGQERHDGIAAVHPVQIYLDLLAHPERAKEAAENLRAEHLNWPNP